MSPGRSTTRVTDPIFVVGAPRSGTHLLRYCLDRHSRISIGPESGLFIRIHGNRRLLRPRVVRRRPELVADLILGSGDPSMADHEAGRGDLEARVRRAEDAEDLLNRILGFFQDAAGTPRVGEKTPMHSLFIDEIFAIFPKARVVAIEREPRNVVASYLRSSHMPDRMERALIETRACVEAIRQADGPVHRVRYEDLVAEPETVLRGVATAVGEDFEPAMLRPGVLDSSFGDEVMTRDPSIGIRMADDEAEKWRRVLSDEQAEWVLAWMDRRAGDLPAPLRRSTHLAALRFGAGILKARLGFEAFPSRPSIWRGS